MVLPSLFDQNAAICCLHSLFPFALTVCCRRGVTEDEQRITRAQSDRDASRDAASLMRLRVMRADERRDGINSMRSHLVQRAAQSQQLYLLLKCSPINRLFERYWEQCERGRRDNQSNALTIRREPLGKQDETNEAPGCDVQSNLYMFVDTHRVSVSEATMRRAHLLRRFHSRQTIATQPDRIMTAASDCVVLVLSADMGKLRGY